MSTSGVSWPSCQFDPLTLPIVSVSSDRALHAEEIDAAALRVAFAAPRSWIPETIVEPSIRAKHSAPTAAAVLIGLVQRDEGLSVLLTQRTAHLHDHAGQISFPGGRVEPEDVDATATALRETQEEVWTER